MSRAYVHVDVKGLLCSQRGLTCSDHLVVITRNMIMSTQTSLGMIPNVFAGVVELGLYGSTEPFRLRGVKQPVFRNHSARPSANLQMAIQLERFFLLACVSSEHLVCL